MPSLLYSQAFRGGEPNGSQAWEKRGSPAYQDGWNDIDEHGVQSWSHEDLDYLFCLVVLQSTAEIDHRGNPKTKRNAQNAA